MLWTYLIMLTKLIGAEGTKTPRKCYRIFFVRGRFQRCPSMSCGRTGQGGPRRRISAEEAPRTARGKRSAWRKSTGRITNLFSKSCRKKLDYVAPITSIHSSNYLILKQMNKKEPPIKFVGSSSVIIC